MKWMIVLVFLSLNACQTKSRFSGPLRNPDAIDAPAASAWQEIWVDEPATFLDTAETEKRIKERHHKMTILRKCGVSSFFVQILEVDLLFIRLENWPEGRLQKEYSPKMSPQNLRCLRDNINPVVS